MSKYVMVGRPISNPVLAAHLVNHGVGETFEAEFDKNIEKQLLATGSLQIVKEPQGASKQNS